MSWVRKQENIYNSYKFDKLSKRSKGNVEILFEYNILFQRNGVFHEKKDKTYLVIRSKSIDISGEIIKGGIKYKIWFLQIS